jgi:hypothetical protein
VPAQPASTSWLEWASYAVRVLGLVEQGEGYRADTADCLDAHRKAGDIR